jgi:hypothetical protein
MPYLKFAPEVQILLRGSHTPSKQENVILKDK